MLIEAGANVVLTSKVWLAALRQLCCAHLALHARASMTWP